MKKLKGALFFIIFGFIVVFSIVDLVSPDRVFSENENKYLAVAPKVTFRSLVDGSFATKYESYICDQFSLRDRWIELKSVCEYALLKTENNGVAYGRDGYMFQKYASFDENSLRGNLEAIDKFAYANVSDVYVMAVPSAFSVLADRVPAGLPCVDENYFINDINRYLSNSAIPVNVKDTLCVNSDQYIYYRTDHHWTTYGAWLAYSQFASARGLDAFSYGGETPNTVDGFLGTSYSKSKLFNAKPDTIEYFDFSAKLTTAGETHDSIYNFEQFGKRDKYAAFLYGNNSITEIETDYSADKLDSLLIIKDSYADCLTPFLTEHYNSITLIDPRYYNGSYRELAEAGYTDVLIIFGFEDLCGESSIKKLGLLES